MAAPETLTEACSHVFPSPSLHKGISGAGKNGVMDSYRASPAGREVCRYAASIASSCWAGAQGLGMFIQYYLELLATTGLLAAHRAITSNHPSNICILILLKRSPSSRALSESLQEPQACGASCLLLRFVPHLVSYERDTASGGE